MKASHDPALQQTPERLDVVGVHLAAHVLAFAVAYGFMRESRLEPAIAGVLVGSHKVNFVADSLADKTIQCPSVGILDDLADHVALATDSSDDTNFAATLATAYVSFLVPVAVFILPADERLIYFDDAHQLAEIRIIHRGTQPVPYVPGRMSGGALAEEHTPQLQRRYALLALEHRVQHFEPSQEWNVSVLEDGADQYGEPIWITVIPALPSEGSCRALVDFCVTAARAARAIRPSAHCQISFASGLIRKGRHKFLEGHHARKYSAGRRCSQVPSYPPYEGETHRIRAPD